MGIIKVTLAENASKDKRYQVKSISQINFPTVMIVLPDVSIPEKLHFQTEIYILSFEKIDSLVIGCFPLNKFDF